MKTNHKRQNKQPLSVRLDPDIIEPIKSYAKKNERQIAWVVSRVLRLGLPIFFRKEAS